LDVINKFLSLALDILWGFFLGGRLFCGGLLYSFDQIRCVNDFLTTLPAFFLDNFNFFFDALLLNLRNCLVLLLFIQVLSACLFLLKYLEQYKKYKLIFFGLLEKVTNAILYFSHITTYFELGFKCIYILLEKLHLSFGGFMAFDNYIIDFWENYLLLT
jgi:hypothetical protein